MSDVLDLVDWIEERRQNCLRIAKGKRGEDRAGWMEDASYFARCGFVAQQLTQATGDQHANCPLRTYIALRLLRAWNSGTAGFSADVVMTVNAWIDGGMKGPLPWPDNPFFSQWAEANGFQKVGESVGFRFEVNL